MNRNLKIKAAFGAHFCEEPYEVLAINVKVDTDNLLAQTLRTSSWQPLRPAGSKHSQNKIIQIHSGML